VSAAFELVSDWQLAAPIAEVWSAIHEAETWPRWWRYVQDVQPLQAGDADGVGAVRRFRWSSRLPYGLQFDVQVIESVRERRLRGRASGQLEGEGLWELAPEAQATRVRYTWRVDLNKPWMQRIAPLAAPVFRWNHNGVMAAGAEGLARHLGARLISRR